MDFQNRLEQKKIDTLFDQAPVVLWAGIIATIITFILYYGLVSHNVLFGWLGATVVLHAIRWLCVARFRAMPASSRDYRHYYHRYLLYTLLAGGLWAILAIYQLHDLGLQENLLMMLILGGITAGAVATHVVILPVFFGFVLPATVPVILYLFVQRSPELLTIGVFISLFITMLSLSARRLNHMIVASLSLQYENLGLLEDLEREKNNVARLNRDLKSDLALRKETEQYLKNEKDKAEEMARTLLTISTLDGLTGIANRRDFDSSLAREWNLASRSASPLSLIMCDIDDFKAYNDYYGHQKGDRCLIQIAGLLQEHARRVGDVAARYGGEEFAIILPVTAMASAVTQAEKMRKAIEALEIPHAASRTGRFVTASFGVASMIPEREYQSGTLVARADQALYKAKHQGRNRVLAFESDSLQSASATPRASGTEHGAG